MKRPCFDLWERIALKEGDSRMMQRFNAIKAGRDLEKQLKKDLDRLFSPIISRLSNILTKFN